MNHKIYIPSPSIEYLGESLMCNNKSKIRTMYNMTLQNKYTITFYRIYLSLVLYSHSIISSTLLEASI